MSYNFSSNNYFLSISKINYFSFLGLIHLHFPKEKITFNVIGFSKKMKISEKSRYHFLLLFISLCLTVMKYNWIGQLGRRQLRDLLVDPVQPEPSYAGVGLVHV